MTDLATSVPDLNWWLSASKADISARVRTEHLAVRMSLDGSTRYFLLHYPDPEGKVRDYNAYARLGIAATFRLIELLFSLGIETVLILCVWAPDIDRREGHLQMALQSGQELVLGHYALDLYQGWQAKSRLYGNYDLAPSLAPIADGLRQMQSDLIAKTPDGERLVLWGYCGGAPNDEMIARSILLFKALGRIPTEVEVRHACFPFGPAKLDISIGAGWLRAGGTILPPILNSQGADLYSLSHLTYELNEYELRRILYDSLFARRASSPRDTLVYSPDVLASLADYYDKHRNCLVGLGHVVAGISWSPDHDHNTV